MPPAERKLEPFKELFNRAVVEDVSTHIKRRWSGFDAKGFIDHALKDFQKLEMKARANQIAAALVAHMPTDVPRALKILISSLRPLDKNGAPIADASKGIAKMAVWPMAEYVARVGMDHPNAAFAALRELTIRSTAEFAVRPFIVKHPKKAQAVLKTWAKDANHHVRRLASEGSRPRLPWGLRLKAFVADPAAVLSLLEMLKDDPSEYVRRSVANSLNDIAKDHPDLIAALAARWLKNASQPRVRLVRHACRTLIKAGHGKTLAALGFAAKPAVKLKDFKLVTPKVTFGAHAGFSAVLHSTATTAQNIVVDYVIHHRKKNGGTAPKVFKWKTLVLGPKDSVRLERRHAFKPITTRVYYPGRHRVEVMVNGRVICGADFDLLV